MAQDTQTNSDQPQTMADLLAKNNVKIVSPKVDSTVEGVIVAKTPKSVVIDINAKTEGVIIGKEYDIARDYIAGLEVGQRISVTVANNEGSKNQILLSLRQAANKQKWDYFYKALESGETVEVKGIETNKGGLIVLINGIRGFIPSSQFGKLYLGRLSKLRGEMIKVKTIEVDHEKNRLIFSEKYVSEAKELSARNEALQKVQPGDVYEGVVSGVMPFGVFVTAEVPVNDKGEIGLIEGLVHISEISWEKVVHPASQFKLGDRVKVKVIDSDPDNEKLNLSIKQLTDDPWLSIEQRYPVGTVVSGVVSRVESFGAFINVEPGVDGLIHNSKLDNDQKLRRGETISVNVESIDKEAKRMSLSLVTNEIPVNYK